MFQMEKHKESFPVLFRWGIVSTYLFKVLFITTIALPMHGMISVEYVETVCSHNSYPSIFLSELDNGHYMSAISYSNADRSVTTKLYDVRGARLESIGKLPASNNLLVSSVLVDDVLYGGLSLDDFGQGNLSFLTYHLQKGDFTIMPMQCNDTLFQLIASPLADHLFWGVL